MFVSISLNGIIATPDNKEDFLSHVNWLEFVKATHECGCLIWGRKTYELVKKWDKSYLEPLADITKVILSSDPELKLEKGFLLANKPQAALNKLEELGFSKTILTGGATNNSAFAIAGLINEIVVDVEGVIIGQGFPLFSLADFKLALELQSSQKISDNILRLHYKVLA